MTHEILFLAHRTPFPPDRGDKIRSHHVLKALAKLGPVHVGCLAETDDDLAEEAELAEVATTYCMPKRTRALPVAGVEALLKGVPVSLSAFYDKSLHAWVAKTLAERPISAIYVFSGQMGQYVPASWKGRLVVDFVDVDSAKFEAYARNQGGPMALVHGREGRVLRAYENTLAARADVSLLVSEQEAALLKDRCPQAGDVLALRNGVDCALFDPAAVEPQPEISASQGPHFLFTGQMDYAPNVDAVTRFGRKILPQIRASCPEAQFHIAGRAPTAAVAKLAEEPGVRVWGSVPDMRPFLAAADMVVAPLTIARGVQNKVLEAMAMARPVLASPEALTGIDGASQTHFVSCADDEAFVANACTLLAAPQRMSAMGQSARQLVEDTMSWPAMLAALPELLGIAPGEGGHRDAA